ncbi:DUF2809 domain-containing protein [Agromyces sp. ISL-38]|uniref:DUF2809 domain-containing protein n=1 Tax=Agromyces sp. ISL-38 TaxID=2819107 RepID=UPI001BE68760|nr:DUF2809 domain-containing protein [Agromyces sp. ISL-38]MBT2498024.1 DUF2809 domain-containing protein [Agromyces sp. ISL-38]
MPRLTASPRNVRRLGALGAVACIALGLGLQLLDRSPILDVLGSILYVVLVGLLVLLVRPTIPEFVVASVAFAIATAIELLQLTGIPDSIGAVVPLAPLVLGSAFDPIDLVAYVGGAVLLFLLLHVITRLTRDVPTSGVADESIR